VNRVGWLVPPIVIGCALLAHQALVQSATYDEATYLRVAAEWWRTGEQESITRMGSPLLFWRLQFAPSFWLLERTGRADWIEAIDTHEPTLIALARISSLWLWIIAILVTARWAHELWGPRAGILAAWVFALEPTILGHSALVTMEGPILAASAALLYTWWKFLITGRRSWFWTTAVVAGVAFSCKFSAVLWPPVCGLAWLIQKVGIRREKPAFALARVTAGMLLFLLTSLAVDFVVTGGAMLAPSERTGEHPSLDRFGALQPVLARLYETPLPQDWVGFAIQTRHQRSGGPSYLFGEVRDQGFWNYYPFALAVKASLGFLALLALRLIVRVPAAPDRGAWFPALAVGLVFLACIIGSKRNYGVRYLLPLASPSIVWISGLAQRGRKSRVAAWCAVGAQAAALAFAHPNELAYFNAFVGGPQGGRAVLADSNLDWGQGLVRLAKLLKERPELSDLTLFYFGNTSPNNYGITCKSYVFDAVSVPSGLPPALAVDTDYLAVSASLQFGPWGVPGYFDGLAAAEPVALLDDASIAIYRATDIEPTAQAKEERRAKNRPAPR
jgi:hypothetical protein